MNIKREITNRINKIGFILGASESQILEQDILLIRDSLIFKDGGSEEEALLRLNSLTEIERIERMIDACMLGFEKNLSFSRVSKYSDLTYSTTFNQRILIRYQARVKKESQGIEKPVSLCKVALQRLYKESVTKKRTEKIQSHIRAFNTSFRSLNFRMRALSLSLESERKDKAVIKEMIESLFSQLIRDSLMVIKNVTASLTGYDTKRLFDFYRGILGWWLTKEIDFSRNKKHQNISLESEIYKSDANLSKAHKELSEFDVIMASIRVGIKKSRS